MTSGGILGPLPSYGFCFILRRTDVHGITGYEFADGGVGPVVDGIPGYGGNEYASTVTMSAKAFNVGRELFFFLFFFCFCFCFCFSSSSFSMKIRI